MNKNMGTMEIRRLVLSMSIPIIISMLVQALYNIVDGIFVAQISEDALAAVTLSGPMQTVMVAIACGTGVGVNAMISRYLGKKQNKEAEDILNHGLWISIFYGVVFALIGCFGSRAFLNLFVDDTNILTMGQSYLRICMIGSVSIFLQITFERVMQATGHAIYNMIMQGVGALVNIILDPIFIFELNMGVKGAALATVIGQFVALCIGLKLTQSKIDVIHVHMLHCQLKIERLKEIYRIGFPAIMIQSIMSVMTVGMNAILVSFGTLTVSVFGIYYKLSTFLLMAVNGINNALIPIISFNYGAKEKGRIYQAVDFALLLSVAAMGVGSLVAWMFPEQLLRMFDASEDMLLIGIPAIKILGLSFIPTGINIILSAALQALNASKASLLITICRQLAILLPLVYILTNYVGLGTGWMAFVITETACMIVSIVSYTKLKKRI